MKYSLCRAFRGSMILIALLFSLSSEAQDPGLQAQLEGTYWNLFAFGKDLNTELIKQTSYADRYRPLLEYYVFLPQGEFRLISLKDDGFTSLEGEYSIQAPENVITTYTTLERVKVKRRAKEYRIQFAVVYQADGVLVLHRLDKGDYLYLQKQ